MSDFNVRGGVSDRAPDLIPLEPAYYNSKMGQLTFSELWRFANANPFVFIIGIGCKLLNVTSNITKVPPEINIVNSPEAFGDDFEQIRSMHAEITALGFTYQFSYTIKQIDPNNVGFALVYLGRDPRVVFNLVYSRAHAVPVMKTSSCVSKLSNDRLLTTTTSKRFFNGNPLDLTENLVGGSPAVIHARHSERLAHHGDAQPVPPEQLIAFIHELNIRFSKYMIQRRVFVRASEQDVIRAKSRYSCGSATLA